VEVINAEGYEGNPGDLIRVQATDDFKVTEVRLVIFNASLEVIESGPCQLDTLGIWWEYTATETVSALTGIQITVTARDIPGNSGEATLTL